jgi:ArsR family transcriptional regulator
MAVMNKELFRLHAEVCKALSSAKRLEILNILRHKEMSAGDIVAKMKIPKANVSQHLAVLRKAGIVHARRNGLNIYYSISNQKVTRACDLMREVLIEHHLQKGKVLRRLG